MLVLGIMSGTSLDSVDYASCDVRAERIRLRAYWQIPFSKSDKALLHKAAAGHANSHEVAQLHHDLGRFYAEWANGFYAAHAHPKPALIGLHGQTIFHNSAPGRSAT